MKKTLVWLLTISLVLACMPAMGMAESLGTIKVWYSGDNEGTRVELFEKAKAEIEAEYPGTTVEIETIAYSELNAKQLTACRAGVGVPDVMSQSATATNGFMVEGLLLPLEDLMADLGRDLKAEFNPAFFSLMEDEEHIYGVPQSKTALVLVYNKTLFEEAGIEEPPTTWDELYECAKKLTLTREDGTKQYGFAYPGTNAGNIWFRIVPAIWSAGGEIYSEDGKTSLVDSEATREAVRHYTSFYLDGLAPESTLELDAATICQMVASGTVAMYMDNIGAVTSNLEGVIDVGTALYPGKDGIADVGMGGWNLAIPATTENPKGAAIFIDKVTNAEAMELQLKLPALAASLQDEQWTQGINAAYSEMLSSHVRELPPFVNLAGAQNAMMTMLQSVMTGMSTVEQAVSDCSYEIQMILDEQNAE